ncbi:MAG: methyltransferase family protein [Gammaproteobacteria bacterium]
MSWHLFSELNSGHLALFVAWLVYAVLHSLLASLAIKNLIARTHPSWLPGYRLAFNAIGVIALIPVAYLHYRVNGPMLWTWDGWLAAASWALTAAAVLAFIYSLRFYDGSEFFGLRQWRARERRVEDQESLHISPLHRWVRHPWYTIGIVLIWTRDIDVALLISGAAITGYFAIGSRLEERKLITYHGDAYKRYMERVPGLIPLPWKHLSRTEARQIQTLR